MVRRGRGRRGGRGCLLMIFSTADSSRLLSPDCREATLKTQVDDTRKKKRLTSIYRLTSSSSQSTPRHPTPIGSSSVIEFSVFLPAWPWSHTAFNCIASTSSSRFPLLLLLLAATVLPKCFFGGVGSGRTVD